MFAVLVQVDGLRRTASDPPAPENGRVNDHGPLTSLFNQARGVYGSTVPIALHENGPIPDPAQLQSSATRWVLFNTWHTDFIQPGVNATAFLNTVYNSSYVVTRDEVPNLR